jgi:hypothetical protein
MLNTRQQLMLRNLHFKVAKAKPHALVMVEAGELLELLNLYRGAVLENDVQNAQLEKKISDAEQRLDELGILLESEPSDDPPLPLFRGRRQHAIPRAN